MPQPRELMVLLGATPAYNMSRILEALDNNGWYRPCDSTPFHGVRAVQPGHVVTIGKEQPTTRSFYSPFELVAPDGPETQPEELATTLVEATRSVTHQASSIHVSLSGGLDSSSVAWAATQAHSDVTATHMLMTRDDPGGEWAHAQSVAEHLGISLTEHDVRETLPMSLVPLEAQCPPYPSRSLLSIAHVPHHPDSITLAGEGGDAVFNLWSYPWHIHDHLLARDWRRAWTQAWEFCYVNGTPMMSLLGEVRQAEGRRRRSRSPSHSRENGVYAVSLPEWIGPPQDDGEHAFPWTLPRNLGAGRSSHIYMLWANALRYSNDVLPQKSERFCVPFALPVVELMLRTPIHQLADVRENNRALLRHAVAPHLPHDVVHRWDKGENTVMVQRALAGKTERVEQLVANGVLAREKFIDVDGAMAAYSRAVNGVPEAFTGMLDVLMLELWFEAWAR